MNTLKLSLLAAALLAPLSSQAAGAEGPGRVEFVPASTGAASGARRRVPGWAFIGCSDKKVGEACQEGGSKAAFNSAVFFQARKTGACPNGLDVSKPVVATACACADSPYGLGRFAQVFLLEYSCIGE